MFKIDKNTHMMILFTFALIFVVVYLYYTITDVRKMQKELVKLSEEVKQLQQCKTQVCQKISTSDATTSHAQTPQQTTQQLMTPQEVVCNVPVVEVMPNTSLHTSMSTFESQMEQDVKDDDSVLTEDVRETLQCTDDEDVDITAIQQEKQVVSEETSVLANDGNDVESTNVPQTQYKFDATELSKLKYDDIKELCKKNNINIKGSKEVLIKRLLETSV